MNKNIPPKSVYFAFCIALILTTFEYFFRLKGSQIFLLPIMLLCFNYNRSRITEGQITVFAVFFIISILQCIFSILTLNGLIGQICFLLNSIILASMINRYFTVVFVKTISFIAKYSCFIYFMCIIFNPICEFLVNQVCPLFISLNVEDAVDTGGGINFMIYNFQVNPLQITSMLKNCGPFWEPGMFAVMLNLALFLNIFVLKNTGRNNIILIVAIITTFSTAGYIILSFIFIAHSFYSKSKWSFIITLAISVGFIYFTWNLDFMWNKFYNDFESASTNDLTRFGAFYKHIKILKENLFLGGNLSGVTIDNETGILANGISNIFIAWGIIGGTLYYIFMFLSCKKQLSNNQMDDSLYIVYFILLILLAFSQTVTTSLLYYVILMLGLTKQSNKNLINEPNQI